MDRAGIHDVAPVLPGLDGVRLPGAGLAELCLKGVELRDANLYKADLKKKPHSRVPA